MSEAGFYKLRLELLIGSECLAENEEELTVSPIFKGVGGRAITPYQIPESLSKHYMRMDLTVDVLIPNYVVPFSDYKITGGCRVIALYGNPGLAESSEIVSGYFQGWIGQVGGSIVRKAHGKGSILLVTWRLMEHYGTHPIATQVLHKLVQKQSEVSETFRADNILRYHAAKRFC